MVEKVMRDGYVWPDDKIYLVHVVPQLASAINMLAPEAPAPVPSEAQQHILLTTAQDALLKVAKRLQENSVRVSVSLSLSLSLCAQTFKHKYT